MLIPIILVALWPLVVFLTLRHLGKLSPKINAYYDFGKYFPASGSLMVIIYLIFIAVMAIILLLIAKSQLKIIPA